MPAIREIEDAIITRLKKNLSYLKKAGPLSELLKLQADNLTAITPAAFVSYNGGLFTNPCMNTGLFDKDMVFAVIVVTRSAVSQEKLLHGDGGSKIGVYEILEDVAKALKGETLGLSIYPLQPISEDALDGSQTAAVYGITFRTKCRV